MCMASLVRALLVLGMMQMTLEDRNREDSYKSVAEYVMSYGYQYEEHKVQTEDGYILTLWRIPGRLGQKGRGQPVLLQHGVLDNGFSFLFQDFNKNLPTMLLNNGSYDIWIGNSRGTIRSLDHVDKKKHDSWYVSSKYWDFTWDEMGTYDFPATINYIVNKTGHQRIKYICHSQGCSILLAYASRNLEFINSHIQKVVWLAPGAFTSSRPSWIVRFLFEWVHALDILELVNFKNVMAQSWVMWLSGVAGDVAPRLWLWALNLLCGWTKEEHIDLARIPVVAANQFGGSSVRNFQHWRQSFRSGQFQMYDFGEAENIKRYGQKEAPKYDVIPYKEFGFSSMVFSFGRDALVPPDCVVKFLSLLPEESYVYEEVPDTNHLSGFWGDFCHTTMYPKIVEFMNAQT